MIYEDCLSAIYEGFIKMNELHDKHSGRNLKKVIDSDPIDPIKHIYNYVINSEGKK